MNQEFQSDYQYKLGIILVFIRLILIGIFLLFSFIPLLSFMYFIIPQYFQGNIFFLILVTGILLLFGATSIYGILTFYSSLRTYSTILFSIGIIFSFNNPYWLVFGIILSWTFFEFWRMSSSYLQLVKEYENYSHSSIERQKLSEIFYQQIYSYIILIWIVLSLSWVTIFISSNYFIEVGDEFGTLGISISLAVLIFIYLVQKMFKPLPRGVYHKNE